MAKSLLDLVTDKLADAISDKLKLDEKLNDPNFKGKLGEDLTGIVLQVSKLFGVKGKVMKNLYLTKENGETSEIDVLFITDMGILAIESKNYSGWIFGNEKDGFWTASLPNGMKNRFYNPVLQNRTHINVLKAALPYDVPIYSVIVFSNRCELKKITFTSDDLYVVKRDDLLSVIGTIRRKGKNDILEKKQIDEIYKVLKVYSNVDEEIKEKHIENINSKYNKKTSHQINAEEIKTESETEIIKETIENSEVNTEEIITENFGIVQTDIQTEQVTDTESTPNEEQKMICPRCGGKLVFRTAKKGENAGNSFYGCSNFPKCRYVLSTEKKEILPEAEERISDKTETNDDTDTIKDISETMAETPMICPRCGGKLVLRTAKKGENAGNSFYGCSNFPKCRYTKY